MDTQPIACGHAVCQSEHGYVPDYAGQSLAGHVSASKASAADTRRRELTRMTKTALITHIQREIDRHGLNPYAKWTRDELALYVLDYEYPGRSL